MRATPGWRKVPTIWWISARRNNHKKPNKSCASYKTTRKIEKAEAALDWALPAEVLARRIRAFDPFPGMTVPLTTASGVETLKLWQAVAEASEPGLQAGTVLSADASGVRVACGQGVLCLTQLQRPGGKRLGAADFLRGCPLQPGQRLAA